jgi:adenylate kinase
MVVARITGRRSCPKCGAVYHIANMKPKKDGICDKCGSNLVQRPDDTEKVVENRLKNYYDQTAPVVDYYKANNTVYDVDANGKPEDIAAEMFNMLEGLPAEQKRRS